MEPYRDPCGWDDPPEYDPDDAEAQRIAEESAAAADEQAYLETLAEERA